MHIQSGHIKPTIEAIYRVTGIGAIGMTGAVGATGPILDLLYEQKEMMLEEWISEQDKYPELKEKFIQYLHNKDNDETLNMIKDEIKMMMYNKRMLLEA